MHSRRALLYMPGDNWNMINKAITLGVDCICMDMEDGTALNRKAEARATIAKALQELNFGTSEKLARINSVGSGFEKDDIEMVLPCHPDGIVIPKVEHKIRKPEASPHPAPPAGRTAAVLQRGHGGGPCRVQRQAAKSVRSAAEEWRDARVRDRLSPLLRRVHPCLRGWSRASSRYTLSGIGWVSGRLRRLTVVIASRGWLAEEGLHGIRHIVKIRPRFTDSGRQFSRYRADSCEVRQSSRVFLKSKRLLAGHNRLREPPGSQEGLPDLPVVYTVRLFLFCQEGGQWAIEVQSRSVRARTDQHQKPDQTVHHDAEDHPGFPVLAPATHPRSPHRITAGDAEQDLHGISGSRPTRPGQSARSR